MHAPTPRPAVGDPNTAPNAAPTTAPNTAPAIDDDAGTGAELAAVVFGARRRAVRDGDRQIDTAHLLHSLLEDDPEARAVLDDGAESARLLGYLVQRSIGYGLRWQGTVEDSGAIPVDAVSGATPVVSDSDALSPLAAAAMGYAGERAAEGGEPARGLHLFAALVMDPDARAVEVLRRAGLDRHEVLARVEKLLAPSVPGAGWERSTDCPAECSAECSAD
ncbi:Clp protease N-terminal domain-containing protein [Streptomyces sp. NPDC087212]|uniref:Clp protease N-terminal domain-containing protein n=1 Tax=Streptomyces sp. NPDC087212 TaxID=3365766 RepID=UPI00382794E5